jgi:hypothetical protein
MTEATERERRRELDEAETNAQYSDETLNDENRYRDTHDRDRDVNDVGAAEGSLAEGTTSYRGADGAQTHADETERELADRDLDRTDLDRTEAERTGVVDSELDRTELDRTEAERTGVVDSELDRTELDRTEAERVGVDGSGLDRPDVQASDLAQPGTAPVGPGYQNRSGYGSDAVASQPNDGNVSVVDDPDVLMRQWHEVQTGFVDDPRQAVQEADGLVQQVMQQVGQRLATERAGLEQVWSRGGDVSTEDLRQALRQYRSFFNRLLHV